MKSKIVVSSALAFALCASPAFAAPGAATSPASVNAAAPLSISNARVGKSMGRKSRQMGGGAILALVIAAGVIAIPVVDAVRSDDDSDSN